MQAKQHRKAITAALALAALALLVACGSGGSGSSGTPLPSTSPTAAPAAPSTTNASGVVVNDANGSPLAGVPVKLMPWAPCGTPPPTAQITPENDGCPTPLPSPQATTNPQGQFVLNGAPNGHYLLVVGTDSTSATDPVQATVHDNVTLGGGNQTLLAPTLPPVPTITPQPWETNGEYRLATLDPTSETPCFVDWQNERTANNLPAGSIDEWLLENIQALNAYERSPGAVPGPWPGNSYGDITTGNGGGIGGTSCEGFLGGYFAATNGGQYTLDPQTEWFGGQYIPYVPGSTVSAIMGGEWPIDPRAFTDPNVKIWP